MAAVTTSGEQARASLYLGKINFMLIKAVAARRQGIGRKADGARLPAAMAGGPVTLQTITRPLPNGKAELITPLGHKTAVRALPRLLSGLDPADPRLAAARMLVDAVEKVGSIKGADLGGTDSKGGVSDGGATTRIKHAARLRVIEARANGWPIGRTGRIQRGAPRVLLAVQRKRGNRQQILAYPSLVGICVDGLPLDEILRRHGWATHSAHRKDLSASLLLVLDDVAAALGLGRWMPE
jgi:hypothetical protein